MLKMLNIKKILTKILEWIIAPITTNHDYQYKTTSIDRDASTASSDVYPKAHSVYDKNGKLMGYVEGQKRTNGTSGVGLGAYRVVNGTDYFNSLSLGIANDGTMTVGINNPSAWRSALGAQATLSVTTPTISISTSTGTLVSYGVRQYGKVVHLRLNVRNTASVASGSNIYAGTLNTTALRPINGVTSVSYLGAKIFGCQLSSAGAITIRNSNTTASTVASDTSIICSFTYIIA